MEHNTNILYEVDDKMDQKRILLYGFQWVLFMVYGVVWAYSILGVGANLQGVDLSIFITNVVFTMGVSTLLQASAGHRLGAMSAPGAITSIAVLSVVTLSGREYGFQAYNAFIFAGIIVAILGKTGFMSWMKKIWTPLVLGSIIMVLGLSVMSLAATSLAALGFGLHFAVGILLGLLCGFLSIKGKGILATLPAMVVLILGYLFFIISGKFDWSISQAMPVFTTPTIFPYGFSFPPLELLLLMTVVAIFNAMLCFGNVEGTANAVGVRLKEKQTKNTFIVHGLIETSLGGLFGVPPLVPYAENIGFNVLTKVASRYPVYLAGFVFIALSFLGKVVGFMAAIPTVLAGAVLLGFASPLIAVGVDIWGQLPSFATRETFICGFSIFLSMGLSSLDPLFWQGVPSWLSTLLATPVLMTMLSVMVLEQVVFRKKAQ